MPKRNHLPRRNTAAEAYINKANEDKRARWEHFGRELEEKAPQLVGLAVSMALEGDKEMLKFCLNRVIPPIRAIEHRHTAGESWFDLLGEIRHGGGVGPPRFTYNQDGEALEQQEQIPANGTEPEDEQWQFKPRKQ